MRINEIKIISLNGYIGLNVSNLYKKIDMDAVETFASDEIKNKYENSPYRIPLRNRAGVIVDFALVEEQDFERVNACKWHCTRDLYAKGKPNRQPNEPPILLHHYIFQKPERGYVIDHINGDRLDNRLSNLRQITQSENVHNCSKIIKHNTSSQYKGVTKIYGPKYRSQFKSKILYKGKDEKMAAMFYDIYSFKMFGENANNNKLISYQDAINYPIPEDNLPRNISIVENENGDEQFCVKKMFNNKLEKHLFPTLDEAIIKLNDILFRIKLSAIIKEKVSLLNTPIQRNKNGVAFIIAKGEIEVLVSDEDWHKFKSEKWHINKNGYVVNSTTTTLMHKMIRQCDAHDMVVHHINSNRTDNRRENLAVVTLVINSHQKKKKKNASSKYFGVNYDKQHKKWRAKITENGKLLHLGRYEKEEDAARAYDAKALEIYGKVFANLNFIDQL